MGWETAAPVCFMPRSSVGKEPQVLGAGQVQPVAVTGWANSGEQQTRLLTGEYPSPQKTSVLEANTWTLCLPAGYGTLLLSPALSAQGWRTRAGKAGVHAQSFSWWEERTGEMQVSRIQGEAGSPHTALPKPGPSSPKEPGFTLHGFITCWQAIQGGGEAGGGRVCRGSACIPVWLACL